VKEKTLVRRLVLLLKNKFSLETIWSRYVICIRIFIFTMLASHRITTGRNSKRLSIFYLPTKILNVIIVLNLKRGNINKALLCIKYISFLEDLNDCQLLRMVKSKVPAILINAVFWTIISSYLSRLSKLYSGAILFRRQCNLSWLVQLL
jgi:hypothetical protein